MRALAMLSMGQGDEEEARCKDEGRGRWAASIWAALLQRGWEGGEGGGEATLEEEAAAAGGRQP
jgi:hypothetical protein